MRGDAFGADPTARERWFLRSPGEIDDERRTAEQAGREAYAEAIRTGRDVQAQTPDELVQLGRARLAQQAGASRSRRRAAAHRCARTSEGGAART